MATAFSFFPHNAARGQPPLVLPPLFFLPLFFRSRFLHSTMSLPLFFRRDCRMRCPFPSLFLDVVTPFFFLCLGPVRGPGLFFVLTFRSHFLSLFFLRRFSVSTWGRAPWFPLFSPPKNSSSPLFSPAGPPTSFTNPSFHGTVRSPFFEGSTVPLPLFFFFFIRARRPCFFCKSI